MNAHYRNNLDHIKRLYGYNTDMIRIGYLLNYTCIFKEFNGNVVYIYRQSDMTLYKMIEFDPYEEIMDVCYTPYSDYCYIITCSGPYFYIYKYEMNSFIKVPT